MPDPIAEPTPLLPPAPVEIPEPEVEPSKTLKFGTIVGQYNTYEFKVKMGVQYYRVKNATPTEVKVGNSVVFIFSEEGSYIVGISKSIARKQTKVHVTG